VADLADALIIGAGPAGCASAILLAQSGWDVLLVEQSVYPRQKVCGECISAGNLELFDKLGIGAPFRDMAGPELSRVGWMGSLMLLAAEFPPCAAGAYSYGRAVGRDRLDALLIDRARSLGVGVLQPAKVRGVQGSAGNFAVDIEMRPAVTAGADRPVKRVETRHARVLIDAHGSWEPAPFEAATAGSPRDAPKRPSDLFAFKASFDHSRLSPGLLPVISLDGGYGGMVVAEGGRTTLACCIRRDRLKACRESMPGAPAGEAVSAFLHRSCAGVRDALRGARQLGPWLSVGPIRPGIRVGPSRAAVGAPQAAGQVFLVGNAAGESHPLIGEGIAMALQSAHLLAAHLSRQRADALDLPRTLEVNRRYAMAWRAAFAPRIRFAAAVAHAAMQPRLASLSHAVVRRWPGLLTRAARWAGKTRHYTVGSEEMIRHEHA
jgi:2-polyprenyl-6-methoxyphenol hydroxylase-like FAD-dependent oxidoreductase